MILLAFKTYYRFKTYGASFSIVRFDSVGCQIVICSFSVFMALLILLFRWYSLCWVFCQKWTHYLLILWHCKLLWQQCPCQLVASLSLSPHSPMKFLQRPSPNLNPKHGRHHLALLLLIHHHPIPPKMTPTSSSSPCKNSEIPSDHSPCLPIHFCRTHTPNATKLLLRSPPTLSGRH